MKRKIISFISALAAAVVLLTGCGAKPVPYERKSQPEVVYSDPGMLNELKAEQDEEALKLGDYWVDTDRLFTKDNGEPQHPNTTYTWLKRFCESNGLPFHGLHSFRHFAAGSLISAGPDVTTVAGALGHCNSGTTVNLRYGHNNLSSQYLI